MQAQGGGLNTLHSQYDVHVTSAATLGSGDMEEIQTYIETLKEWIEKWQVMLKDYDEENNKPIQKYIYVAESVIQMLTPIRPRPEGLKRNVIVGVSMYHNSIVGISIGLIVNYGTSKESKEAKLKQYVPISRVSLPDGSSEVPFSSCLATL